MAYTYGDVRKMTIKLLDDYSTAGVITSTTDSLIKIRDFVNATQIDLASSTAKINGEFFIPHNPIYNELSRDTSSIKTFLPGGADISVTLVNAKACYFEIAGPATVYIEEAVSGSSTYTNLETITVPTTVTTFTEYRRLITPSLATNMIRLRFTGTYIFNVRNFILYPYPWPTEASIQAHKPYIEYDLPSDFLELSQVMAKKNVRQLIPYTNYILRPDKKIAIDSYDPGEYLVHYWRFPSAFVFVDNDTIDDAQKFGIDTTVTPATYRVSDDAAIIIPYCAAGQVLLSEGDINIPRALTLMNIFEQKKAGLIRNRIGYSSNIINVFGW